MWSLVAIVRKCGIQLFHSTVKSYLLMNVSLCLLYMWHRYITVVSLHYTRTHAVPGF